VHFAQGCERSGRREGGFGKQILFPKRGDKLLLQCRRPNDGHQGNRFFDELLAKSPDCERSEQNVRVKKDSHETFLKTSSSV